MTTPLTPEARADLVAKAKAAHGFFGFTVDALMRDADMQREPAEFINAASPATIIAFDAALTAAEADAHWWKAACNGWKASEAEWQVERDALKAELARLRGEVMAARAVQDAFNGLEGKHPEGSELEWGRAIGLSTKYRMIRTENETCERRAAQAGEGTT
jgi:hypothetical protein